jgi:hypothetical protein
LAAEVAKLPFNVVAWGHFPVCLNSLEKCCGYLNPNSYANHFSILNGRGILSNFIKDHLPETNNEFS